ncbi:hypothetical protein Peur_057609 [Populus x canadensis]
MPKALARCPYQFNGLASGGGTGDGCIPIWNIKVGTCTRSIETKALASYALWDLLLPYLDFIEAISFDTVYPGNARVLSC